MDVACFQDHLRWINWNTCLDMELNDTNKLFDNFFTFVNALITKLTDINQGLANITDV